MISNMVKALNKHLINQYTKVNLVMVQRKVREHTHLAMVPDTLVSLRIIFSMEMELSLGKMGRLTQVNGLIIKRMDKANSLGQMEEYI